MFIGIDHGTTAMRFSTGTEEFKISREEARDFSVSDLSRLCPLEEIEGIAVCYSMGDGISAISDIRKVQGRGVISREGAGKHIGGGTRVYDEIERSGLPAFVIPGLHRASPTDPRFKAYSHQASPEKIGILYEVAHDLGDDVVVCDTSSNTVTLLVTAGRITGAFDACIFAPGTRHGALDVDAIRRIDRGDSTANDAFLHAGVDYTVPPELRVETMAMFAAMECASMLLINPGARVALAGSMAPPIAPGVEALLAREVAVYDEWCAARGLARIARDVFSGATGILGLAVER
ncbi:MAG: methanogenesis marker 12 protein [Methanomicrobiaceae archaeon]|uniref:methanogenesis marker 12 protein n=1 Tax=Methanoculleus sp. TaxID=90427 RepID=UPI00320DB0D8|nr:methanogenesis marker 12 protein [Methanomicrobiaceae archaeon]